MWTGPAVASLSVGRWEGCSVVDPAEEEEVLGMHVTTIICDEDGKVMRSQMWGASKKG